MHFEPSTVYALRGRVRKEPKSMRVQPNANEYVRAVKYFPSSVLSVGVSVVLALKMRE